MTWPLVHPYDDGLRVGKPGRCFYCDGSIGTPHAPDCVTVSKVVELVLEASLPNGEVIRGTWATDVPHSWDDDFCARRHEVGSWCVRNLDGDPGLTWEGDGARKWEAWTGALNEAGDCPCGRVRFDFVRTVFAGPFTAPPRAPPWPYNASGGQA